MDRYNDGIHNRLSAQGHYPMERRCIFLPRADIGMDTGRHGDGAIGRKTSRGAAHHSASIRPSRSDD